MHAFEPSQLGTLLEALPDGVVAHDGDAILYANVAAAALFQLPDAAAVTQSVFSDHFHPEERQPVQQLLLAQANAEADRRPLEMRLRHDDGELPRFIEAITARAETHEHGLFQITTLRDISEKKRAEERIRHQANYDALTGLPNRALFIERLKHELVRADRSDSRVALMFIDLDRFKWVNDTLGHSAGDELLKESSRRLLKCHRQSDTVARLGGDEFTVILPDMARGPYAERVAAEVIRQLCLPFTLEGQEVTISGSVGVTVFPDDAQDLDSLLKNADAAMYKAKSDGRNNYRFFTSDMHDEAMERMQLEKDLLKAIEARELTLSYLPIFDMQSDGALRGAEALLRWSHPTRGYISPELFVPIAEETGMIAELTEWAIDTGLAQAARWRAQHPAAKEFFLSANLSCTRCRELSTDNRIPEILEKNGLPPSALVLEITENIIMEDEPRAMSMLNHLREIGVELWLDDFGTGFSSLSVLRKLPVSGVKIDRAFVPDIISDNEAAVLVETIMSMAHSLDRVIIGEGVESVEQAQFLKARGCHFVQGYHYGKPADAEEFAKFFET
ncbi:putative bifunctional diguanylate cyclase/phosphodiesterase [Magnetofaba australis]|nr:EAL domain-containing protein [Magnetofaba australis]